MISKAAPENVDLTRSGWSGWQAPKGGGIVSGHRIALKDGRRLDLFIQFTRKKAFLRRTRHLNFTITPGLTRSYDDSWVMCELRGSVYASIPMKVFTSEAGSSLQTADSQAIDKVHAVLASGEDFYLVVFDSEGVVLSVPVTNDRRYLQLCLEHVDRPCSLEQAQHVQRGGAARAAGAS